MTKQPRSVQAHHAPVLGLFLNNYEPMRQKMDAVCKRPLLDIAPLVFSKWYYTALLHDTILSPANIVGKYLKGAQENTEYAYVLRPQPFTEPPKTEYASEYRFALYGYSTKEHPLIDDLRTLLDYCRPARTVDEEGFLLVEERAALLKQLSFQTDFYLEYLTGLAWLQGLLVSLPAIHTKRMQPSEDCEAFFSQSVAEMLYQLAETACVLTSEQLIRSMDADSEIASPDFFFSCLQKDYEVDRIFIDFYKQVDIDIASIWETPPEQLREEEHAIVSSFLFFGIMLDKWFLTPMSTFFHFIRPISYTPIDFFSFVNTLSALLLMERNVGAELFAPCTYYSLTPLGMELFADTAQTIKNRQKMPNNIAYEQILATIEQEWERHGAEQQLAQQMEAQEWAEDVLTIKVYPTHDPDFWKLIEVKQDIDIHVFCTDLSAAFYVEERDKYLLSVPDRNGFPIEYSARGSKRSVNIANGKELLTLSPQESTVWTLYPSSGKNTSLTLEITQRHASSPYLQYPRIAKQSKKVVEHEKFDETF